MITNFTIEDNSNSSSSICDTFTEFKRNSTRMKSFEIYNFSRMKFMLYHFQEISKHEKFSSDTSILHTN